MAQNNDVSANHNSMSSEGGDAESGNETGLLSPRKTHDQDLASDGDSDTLREPSSNSGESSDDHGSGVETPTVARSGTSSTAGAPVDVVAACRMVLVSLDYDSDVELDDDEQADTKGPNEFLEATVEREDEVEPAHDANSTGAVVDDEDKQRPEDDGNPFEAQIPAHYQRPDEDTERAVADPMSPVPPRHNMPTPERKSKRRRRHDDDDGGANDAADAQRHAKKSRSKKRAKEARKLTLRDRHKKRRDRHQERTHGLAVINEGGLPTPTKDTFPTRNSRLDDDYKGWKPFADEGGMLPIIISSPPRIADFMNDSPDPVEVAKKEAVKKAKEEKKKAEKKKKAEEKKKAAEEKKKAAAKKKSRQNVEKQGKSRRRLKVPPVPKRTGLNKLPPEIRMKIFSELLRADKPILVHGGWRMVYRRQSKRQSERTRDCQKKDDEALDLPIAILSTCRQFYQEAVAVLYGENTFLYRLRDPTATLHDVARIAHIDTNEDKLPDSEYEHESDVDAEEDPDWQADSAARQGASRRRARRAEETRYDIDVAKHMHLFRRIVVEAEHNRFSKGTKRSMARAINTFATREPAMNPGPNIRSLTVRVAPLCDGAGGVFGGFTFADFFVPESPVMQAMRAVRCSFLKVDLMTRYMDGPSERAGCSLTVDRRQEMQHLQSAGPEGEYWPFDVVARGMRKVAAKDAERALDSMGQHVDRFCQAYVQGWAGGLAAERHFWLEFEDVGEGF